MAWPYARTIPAENVQLGLEEITFNFRTARFTVTYTEGEPSDLPVFRGLYSASVDYAPYDSAFYGGYMWKATLANGPATSVVTPVEGATWTKFHVTYDPTVNDADQVYMDPTVRIAYYNCGWAEFLAALSTVTSADMQDMLYTPTGKLNTALVELYEYLKANGQEPLPAP
jgi:hypothetical protein